MVTSALEKGQRISEYLLVERIDGGTFGEVWKAHHHIWHDQVVAIKIPTQTEYVRALQQEGLALHNLMHPCIVRPIGFDPFADPPYLVMEYVPGTSLRPLIRDRRLTPEQSLSVLRQMLAALQVAHKKGIVHRDIKPENILVHRDAAGSDYRTVGTIKVADFGLGKAATVAGSILYSQSMAGSGGSQVAGTLNYMSPEQHDGEEVDARADIYACGVVLFEMLTGKRPAGFDLPSHLNPQSPTAYDEIFKRCYARKEQRYASAAEFHAAVEAVAAAGRQKRLQPLPAGGSGQAAASPVPRSDPPALPRPTRQTPSLPLAPIPRIQQPAESISMRGHASDGTQNSPPVISGKQGLSKPAKPPRMRRLGRRILLVLAFAGAMIAGIALWRHHIKIYPIALGEPIRDTEIRSADFSPDGTRLITYGEHNFRLWDAATGKPIGEPIPRDYSITFNRAGNRALTVGFSDVCLWDAGTGELVAKLTGEHPPVRDGRYLIGRRFADFSADGKRIVTTNAGTARVWDAATGKPVGEPMRHDCPVSSAAFDPDGARIVTTNTDDAVLLWDANGKPIGELTTHEHGISVTFSPDSKWIVTRSSDGARLWEAATGKPIGEPMRHDGRVDSAEFSPDGARIVTAGDDGTVRVWDVLTSKPIGEPMHPTGGVQFAEFSRDGARIITRGREVRIRDAATGKPIGDPMPLSNNGRNPATFSPDGACFVTQTNSATVLVWDAVAGKPLGQPIYYHGEIHSFAFSPDGTRIIITGYDGQAANARIWDAATGKMIGEPMLLDGAHGSATFSPDGARVVTVTNGTARLWDVSALRVPAR